MKYKVTLFLQSAGKGGAERFMIGLANELSANGHEVSLVVTKNNGEYEDELRASVEYFNLDTSKMIFALPKLISYIKHYKPDYLISSVYNANMVAATSGLFFKNTKVIVRESSMHIDMKNQLGGGFIYKIIVSLMKYLYKKSYCVVTLTNDMFKEMNELLPASKNKIKLINNFIDIEQIQHLSGEKLSHPWIKEGEKIPIILGIGRLVHQKNWRLLLDAFARLSEGKECRLVILGEGIERNDLEIYANKLGISKKLYMPGFISNPFPWLKFAKLFVLTSNWEGFPNVLAQALSVGCNIISTRCGSGPSEILEDGKWGRLIEKGNLIQLVDALEEALGETNHLDGRSRAKKFSKTSIVKKYENLFING